MMLKAPFDLSEMQSIVDRVNDAQSQRRHAFELIHYAREHGTRAECSAAMARFIKANDEWKSAVAKWEGAA